MMRKSKFFFLFVFMLALFVYACGSDDDKDEIVRLTILQTSDIHHHASGYGPFSDYTSDDTTDNDGIVGGYARLATLISQTIEEQAAKGIPVLLFDSGDFFMGTSYDLTVSDPIGLKFFSLMNYDAITLGNHEFDWAPAGLAMLISNAMQSESLPFQIPIVATNMITDETDARDDGLEGLISAGAIVNKKIIRLSHGLNVGILGLNGPTSDQEAPLAKPVTFNHDFSFIQEQVDDLRNNHGVQMVVILSHGGVKADGTGEDADLANNVSGIDAIASGHYHTATHEALNISDTIIFSPGEYGEWISRLDITYNVTQNSIADYTFNLIPVDDATEGNAAVRTMLEQYHEQINLALAPLSLTSPVSKTGFSLETAPFQETGLGNLTADAIRTIANLLTLEAVQSAPETTDPSPFSVGIVPSGSIRDGLYPGRTGIITFSDIYNVLPLGISPDPEQLPGYPLISIYVTAPEIRNTCEAAVSIAPLTGSAYYLNFSGIRFDYDESAPPFQKVTRVYLCGNPLPAEYGGDNDVFSASCLTQLDLTDTDTLYRSVVDLYSLQMMGVVTSQGLSIEPKNADGDIIDLSNPQDYMQYRIDAENSTEGMQELKEWAALLQFLGQYFPASGDGIPESVYGPDGVAMGRVNKIGQ